MDKVLVKLESYDKKLLDDIENTKLMSVYRNTENTITVENLLTALDEVFNYAKTLERTIKEIEEETGKNYTWDKYKI